MSLYLNVSPQVEARLTAAAHQQGIDIAALIEKLAADLPAVETQADESRSLYDRFRDVIGIAEGLPSDMSRNPEKYMTGFGETRTSDR